LKSCCVVQDHYDDERDKNYSTDFLKIRCKCSIRATDYGKPTTGILVPVITKQYKFGTGASCKGNRIGLSLASHWPCVTDISGLPTYGLNGQRQGDEHPCLCPLGGTI